MSAAVAPARGQAQAPPPTFLRAAKLREQPVTTINYVSEADAGTPHPQPLRNVGYLHRLNLVTTQAATYATAGPTGTDSANTTVGPIGRVAVRANSIGTIFDVAGYFVPVISAVDVCYNESNGGSVTPQPYAFTASPGTAATTNKFAYRVPISISFENWPSPLGLYQTAISGNETDLEVRFTAIAGAAGAAPGTALYLGNQANLGGQSVGVAAEQVYFDPIPQGKGQPIYAFMHKWTDQQYGLNADGDNDLPLNNANIYLRWILFVVTGGAGALAPDATHVTRIRVQYGGNIAPFDWTVDQLRARMARHYGNITFPAGFYIIDLIADTHSERDALNASATTDLRITITTSGATYSGGAYVRVASEYLAPFNVPANAVGLQGGLS